MKNQLSPYAKPKTLISFAVTAFGFATRIVHFVYFFQSLAIFCDCTAFIYVGPVRKPHCCFSHVAAQISVCIKLTIEPVREKTNNLGFRPGPTQTRLYTHRRLI